MNKKNIYKALANEQRLNLLECIRVPKSVNEMLSHCSLTQSALSQHLKVLRDANVVSTERVGKEVVYSLRSKEVIRVVTQILNLNKNIWQKK